MLLKSNVNSNLDLEKNKTNYDKTKGDNGVTDSTKGEVYLKQRLDLRQIVMI